MGKKGGGGGCGGGGGGGGGGGVRGGGGDEAEVINFIFVFLLPQLRVNTIIQSRKKVASFACPFNARCSPGGRKA